MVQGSTMPGGRIWTSDLSAISPIKLEPHVPDPMQQAFRDFFDDLYGHLSGFGHPAPPCPSSDPLAIADAVKRDFQQVVQRLRLCERKLVALRPVAPDCSVIPLSGSTTSSEGSRDDAEGERTLEATLRRMTHLIEDIVQQHSVKL